MAPHKTPTAACPRVVGVASDGRDLVLCGRPLPCLAHTATASTRLPPRWGLVAAGFVFIAVWAAALSGALGHLDSDDQVVTVAAADDATTTSTAAPTTTNTTAPATTTSSTTSSTTAAPTTTTTAAPASRPAHSGVWDRLAGCESGGRWSIHDSVHEGGLQFAVSTWDSFKPAGFPDGAHQATREQQILVAERVLDAQGWRAWPTCSRKLGLR